MVNYNLLIVPQSAADFIEGVNLNIDSNAVATNKKDAKSRFFGGISQRRFDEYLQEVNAGEVSIFRFLNQQSTQPFGAIN